MKQYKVGDTIYVKGKIADVDHNETMLPYCVVSSPNYHFWASQESVVDELPTAEPVKPVLPKYVADELTEWRNSPHYVAEDTYFDQLIYEMISNSVESCLVKTRNSFIDGDIGIKTLLDAWCNGYTVEKSKPKLYNLILGIDSNDHRSAFYKGFIGIIINADTSIGDLDDLHYQFTQEQIDKYNEDFWIKNLDLNDYKVEVEE